MVAGADETPTPKGLAPVLASLNLPSAVAVDRLPGGSNAVFAVDLTDGTRVNLKIYDDRHGKAPEREAHAAALLADAGIPATRYLLIDESGQTLPFRFALTSHLSGESLDTLKDQVDLTDAYRDMGALLRRVHSVQMAAYGQLDEAGQPGPHATNLAFIGALAKHALEQFEVQGGAPDLTDRLRRAVADTIHVAQYGARAVFAHDDFHPGNIIAARDGDGVRIIGIIDFGNARATDPLFDLAKAMFNTDHMAPGAGVLLLEGYGALDHPDPGAGAMALPAAAPGHHVVLAAPDRRHRAGRAQRVDRRSRSDACRA